MGTYTLTHTHANLVFGQNVNNLLLCKRLFVCICVCIFVYLYASLSPVGYPCGADTFCARKETKIKARMQPWQFWCKQVGSKSLVTRCENAAVATQPAVVNSISHHDEQNNNTLVICPMSTSRTNRTCESPLIYTTDDYWREED